MAQIVNARIKSATIEMGRGNWTSFLNLEWGSTGQGYGGYRLHGEWMFRWISQVCATLGVERWSDVEGSLIRIKISGTGMGGQIHAIGHIMEDRWLDWAAYAEALQADRETMDQ